jgi:hypothetical protein
MTSSLFACGGGDLVLPNDKAPAALKVVSGDGQEGTVGSRLPAPLVVVLTDAAERPVPGVPLTFRFRDDFPGAEINPASAETNDSGLASTRVTLGSATGPYTVEAVAQVAPDLSTTFGVLAVAKESGPGRDHGPGRDKEKGKHGGKD